VYDDSTSTEHEPSPPMFGRFERDEAPSSDESGADLLGLANRTFRIGYAGRGRGAPSM
jgi:hypothetical protein